MDTQFKNRYYLMRHGESIANKEGLIVSSPNNAINRYGLTTNGANQVLEAALNTRLDDNAIIVSSDYKRAIESANIMHSVISTSSPIVIEPLLRERDFGQWELSDDSYYNNVWQQDIKSPNTRVNNVESVQQTLSRGLQVIKKLESMHQEKKILLVGHGDVLQILLAYYHQIDPRFHRSLNPIANADIRSLSQYDAYQKALA